MCLGTTKRRTKNTDGMTVKASHCPGHTGTYTGRLHDKQLGLCSPSIFHLSTWSENVTTTKKPSSLSYVVLTIWWHWQSLPCIYPFSLCLSHTEAWRSTDLKEQKGKGASNILWLLLFKHLSILSRISQPIYLTVPYPSFTKAFLTVIIVLVVILLIIGQTLWPHRLTI